MDNRKNDQYYEGKIKKGFAMFSEEEL